LVLHQGGLSLCSVLYSGFKSTKVESSNCSNSLELNRILTRLHVLNRFSPVKRVLDAVFRFGNDFTTVHALQGGPNTLIKLNQEIAGVAL